MLGGVERTHHLPNKIASQKIHLCNRNSITGMQLLHPTRESAANIRYTSDNMFYIKLHRYLPHILLYNFVTHNMQEFENFIVSCCTQKKMKPISSLIFIPIEICGMWYYITSTTIRDTIWKLDFFFKRSHEKCL